MTLRTHGRAHNVDEDIQHRTVNRRRLLRRAGTVAAGVAGAGVVSTVVATPAMAASGTFDSNSLSAAAVTATNTATTSEGGVLTAGPHLRLIPTVGTEGIASAAPVGSIATDESGTIWTVVQGGDRHFIHTTQNSNLTVPIAPFRALDTRGGGVGISRIVNPSGNIVSGRLKAGKWVHLDLTGLVNFGEGVFGVLQIVQPVAGGFASVVPFGAVDYNLPPATSNVLYGTNQNVTTLVFSGLGLNSITRTDVISLYSFADAKVIFDVNGFVVDSPGRVPSAGVSGAFSAARRAQIAQHAQN
jgi:hypothetical protein